MHLTKNLSIFLSRKRLQITCPRFVSVTDTQRSIFHIYREKHPKFLSISSRFLREKRSYLKNKYMNRLKVEPG